ncbi:MAG TPA: hypothetical protein VFP32_00965 [Candidatus Saccharimonadales bacterium]|nr:hypothetical protein [Candidatus Saccharimonadales bacterium]
MKKILKFIAGLPYKFFLWAFIICGIVCILALRHNNQQMIKLRDAVYTADKNNGDVNTALNNLRRYVYSHMNTDLSSGNNNIKPPIQLKYTYQRLIDSEQSQLQAANSQIYTDAQNYCQSINHAYYGTTRVPCVQAYVSSHGVDTTLAPVPTGLYEFDFVSPSWSPDLAGWSLALSIVFFMAFIVRYSFYKLANKK